MLDTGRRVVLLFCLLLLTANAVCAQQLSSQATVAYQGETVDSIDVVTNPHVDIEPLRAMVAQKAGQPFSQQKVQDTIAAFEKTQRFEKVRVLVTPEPKGLRLTFVLDPAYYIGLVDFPEAAKQFSYVRLLQIVNFADQDPFDKALLPASEVALQNFLKENGYFQTQVHAETRVDDVHQLVDVIFHVKLGKRASIGTVEIEGPATGETAHLMHSVRSLRARLRGGLLKPDKVYTAGRLKEAKILIKSSLSRQGHLAGTVQQKPPIYHPETNRVDVSFYVVPGSVVIVRTEGARLTALPFMSGRERKKLIPIYSEGATDQDLVDEGREQLVDYFQKKGYFDVEVTTTFERQPEKISLTYLINKGRKHKVSRIVFQGNHALAEHELLDHIPITRTHLFWTRGAYSGKLLKTSVANIQALYHDIGYEEVKVTTHVVDHETKLDISFNIAEGQRTLVDNVSVIGNKNIASQELTGGKGFQLNPGAPFSPGKLASDRNQISATYLDRGYLNSDVKATLRRHPHNPHEVDIAYEITENQLVCISQVLYEGQQHTRLSMLQNSTAFQAETPLSQKHLLESETDLYNLNIFDWTSVGPARPITDQTDEDVVVKVHEAKRTEIIYGFGFEISRRGGNVPGGSVAVPGLPTVGIGSYQIAPSQATYASPQGSIEIVRRNLRGRAETGSFSLLASRLDQRALASYGLPHLGKTQWSALSNLSFERTTENPLFAADLADAAFQVERILNKKTNSKLQLRYDFNHTSLSQLLVPALVLPEGRNVRLSTLSSTYIRDTRDKPLDAHKGSYATLNLGVTPTAFGSSANFTRLFAQYAFYKPVHGMVWANSVRVGLDRAFSGSFVPTSQLFFAGGGTTIRGFPTDEAGPQRIVPFCNVLLSTSGCVNVTVPVGGRQLFVLNSELRFPLKIMEALGGIVFYDGGNVYTSINLNQFVSNYTNTIGIGLRYATPIGPIRVDLGRNLNPVPGIGATQYFITLGQAF
jgi:outer membrane protein assembly factor BamA